MNLKYTVNVKTLSDNNTVKPEYRPLNISIYNSDNGFRIISNSDRISEAYSSTPDLVSYSKIKDNFIIGYQELNFNESFLESENTNESGFDIDSLEFPISAESSEVNKIRPLLNTIRETEDIPEEGFTDNSHPPKDIVFVVDISGSMSDDMIAVRDNLDNIFEIIFDSNRNNTRVAVVGYESSSVLVEPFTEHETIEERKEAIRGAFTRLVGMISGGTENLTSALSSTITGLVGDWRKGVVKKIYLIGDEPGDDLYLLPTMYEQSIAYDITVNPIHIGGDGQTANVFQQIATNTGGQYFHTDNASTIVDTLGSALETKPKYEGKLFDIPDKVSSLDEIHVLYEKDNEIHKLSPHDYNLDFKFKKLNVPDESLIPDGSHPLFVISKKSTKYKPETDYLDVSYDHITDLETGFYSLYPKRFLGSYTYLSKSSTELSIAATSLIKLEANVKINFDNYISRYSYILPNTDINIKYSKSDVTPLNEIQFLPDYEYIIFLLEDGEYSPKYYLSKDIEGEDETYTALMNSHYEFKRPYAVIRNKAIVRMVIDDQEVATHVIVNKDFQELSENPSVIKIKLNNQE